LNELATHTSRNIENLDKEKKLSLINFDQFEFHLVQKKLSNHDLTSSTYAHTIGITSSVNSVIYQTKANISIRVKY
jgi:hypothetical protein